MQLNGEKIKICEHDILSNKDDHLIRGGKITIKKLLGVKEYNRGLSSLKKKRNCYFWIS